MSDQTLPQVVQDDIHSLAMTAAQKSKFFGADELDYWKMLTLGILWHCRQVALNQGGPPAAEAWISGMIEDFTKHGAQVKLSVQVPTSKPRKRK